MIQTSFDMSNTFALMDERPRADTREERRRTLVVELNELGQSLSLDEATFLFKVGDLARSTTYRVRDKLKVKTDQPAKAFAKYRESRVIYPPAHAFPTAQGRKKERRRIIKRAKLRRAAVASIGQFCLMLGRTLEVENGT